MANRVRNFRDGMHCLGAVAGSASSSVASNSQNGNRGGVLSVVRALGVLVCEGRIQGPPRGYREGPHCAAPLHGGLNHHKCEKENYLCNRYIVLVKEIAERVSIGANVCVEVVMCNDCPCGLSTATSINPISPIPSTLLTQWSHTSEMLLEYWCIGVVPSKTSEMMNSQGLYQAVRSRLHFSQVAAWWSRSNGTKPTYIATRVVLYNGENLRKFRETPVEHTFPLASIGDGNSVKVTVWALPRMEDIPELKCSLHPSSTIDRQEDESVVARALTPTKNNTTLPQINEQPSTLVLPTLVDDRLQTPCNKSGKHHCRCEEEEASPPSPSIKPNLERKRRRSLPCGPPDIPANAYPLASVSETATTSMNRNDHQDRRFDSMGFDSRAYLNTGTLERYFWTQVSLDEAEGNNEKRYKPSSDVVDNLEIKSSTNNCEIKINHQLFKSQSFVPSDNKDESNSSLSREPNFVVNPFAAERYPLQHLNPGPSTLRKETTPSPCTVHINYSKSNKEKYPPGDLTQLMSKLSFPNDGSKIAKEGIFNWISKVPGRVLNVTPSTTTISVFDDKFKAIPSSKSLEERQQTDDQIKISNAVKLKNCNLELSQREFDEVLAVLRARTPSGRRRTPVKMLRRRERLGKLNEDSDYDKRDSVCVCPIHRELERATSKIIENCQCCSCKKFNKKTDDNKSCKTNEESVNCLKNVSNKADVLLGAILRTSKDRQSLMDISNGTRAKNITSRENNDSIKLGGGQRQDIKTDTKTVQQVKFDDDKFLSLALNKRLHRLKQLFRKEQEKKNTSEIIDTPEEPAYPSVSKKYEDSKDNRVRVKRKIDFSNYSVNSNFDHPYKPMINTPVYLIHHSSHLNSTNYQLKDFHHQEMTGPDTTYSSVSRKSKQLIGNGLEIDHYDDTEEDDGSEDDDDDDDDNDEDDEDDDENVVREIKNNRDGELREEEEIGDSRVPSVIEQERFRRSLENAASMVFHSRTGLPLTSSPAPLRRGSCCFDYDSTLNSVSSKRSALFELNTPPSPGAVSLEETDREIDNSVEGEETPKRPSSTRNRPQSHALLGNFEESALNGRLEPVSTVHGFTAEIGASGSFCPKHRKLPVTVFFYTLGDNDKVSSPYLAHINLGKKGYQVPRNGTIQVTLLNPLGTVVKMFVVLYDLSDMPPRSHTFLRQRTLRDKTLRYLIHLRFMSGKSGRIYLHTDIRMIICRKSDVDTASDFGSEPPKELRSYIHGPTNPKFSPRC